VMSAPSSTTAPSLQSLLESQKEWARAIVFDGKGHIIARTSSAAAVQESEIRSYLTALDDRDTTIGSGFVLEGERFEVHRFHPPLVYGRRGGPEYGEGIALAKGTGRSGEVLFCLITYTLPVLSARAVPQLVKFFRTHLGDLPQWEVSAVAGLSATEGNGG